MELEQKKKPIIPLNEELRLAIDTYIGQKGYAIWTIKKYKSGIEKLFDKYSYLDTKRCKSIMNQKNPNQKALLNLILMSASEAEIELPNIKVSGKIAKKRSLPEINYGIEDVRNMLNCLPTNRDKLLFRCIFSIGAGLRISEAIKMKWNNFNWSKWITHKESHGEFYIKNTKRGNSFAVPVPSEIMSSLYHFAQDNKVDMEMKFLGGGIGFKKIPKSSDYVFKFKIMNFDKDGFMKNVEPEEWEYNYVLKVYHHINYNLIIKHISSYLGHKLRLHSLRHLRATQLINEGVDISIVSKLLGHKNLSTTMIYLDMTTLEQAKAIKGIPIV